MPYIPTETVKRKRKLLRQLFPDWKLSVRTVNHSKISVSIMGGPLEIEWSNKTYPGHESVNHFYIKENFKDQPELCKVLSKIKDIISSEQRELVYDGDYGSVPTYYVGMEIGQWDKPYVVTTKK